MNNKFPQKELEQHKHYLIATDCYDTDQFSYMIMDSDGLVAQYNTLRNEPDFDKEVEKWAEYYNCVDIKEVKAIPREKRIYGNGREIKLSKEFKEQFKKSFEEYCNTDNGQRDLELITDWSLVEEIRNLAHKKIENNEKL